MLDAAVCTAWPSRPTIIVTFQVHTAIGGLISWQSSAPGRRSDRWHDIMIIFMKVLRFLGNLKRVLRRSRDMRRFPIDGSTTRTGRVKRFIGYLTLKTCTWVNICHSTTQTQSDLQVNEPGMRGTSNKLLGWKQHGGRWRMNHGPLVVSLRVTLQLGWLSAGFGWWSTPKP